MEKNENNDKQKKTDNNVSNYENLLNDFSVDDDEKADDKNENVFSELLKGIESQDGKIESKESEEYKLNKEFDNLDIETASYVNFDNIEKVASNVIEDVIEDPESKEEEISFSGIGNNEIDLDSFDREEGGDYTSILGEIDGAESTEAHDEKVTDEIEIEETQEAPAEETPEESITPVEETIAENGETELSLDGILDVETEEAVPSAEDTFAEKEEAEISLEGIMGDESEEAPQTEAVPAGEIILDTEESNLSYESLIEGEAEETLSEETSSEETLSEEPSGEPETYEIVDDSEPEEVSPEAEPEDTDQEKDVLESLVEDEFSLTEENEEKAVTGEFQAQEEEETFVISVGGDDETEEDFLGLAEDTVSEKEDDGLLGGLTGGKQETTTEVLMKGIEMEVEEQISNVTLAELLISLGKGKEAAELLKNVSDKKGVTPRVSKLLEQLNNL